MKNDNKYEIGNKTSYFYNFKVEINNWFFLLK